jgi:glycosyltransferase involved in cell wall biosynthesis
MARALAGLGHPVKMVVNCPRQETIDCVEYLPLAGVDALEADVVLFNTSGGGMDLSPAQDLRIDAGLKILWIAGVDRPKGLDRLWLDVIYAPSNFLRNVVRETWDLLEIPVFVEYNGFEEHLFQAAEEEECERDPFRLVYLSHPSKGLASGLEVLRKLREADNRYTLHVFGGTELWGGEAEPVAREPNVIWHGMVGQKILTTELLRSSFALHLQDREEPFGMALIESMRAGCVVLASPVGAYPELVRDGEDGILISGPCQSERATSAAYRHVMEFTNDPARRARVSRLAQRIPWSTRVMAQVWRGHWEWRSHPGVSDAIQCPICGATSLPLADGDHCTSCGLYAREIAGVGTLQTQLDRETV